MAVNRTLPGEISPAHTRAITVIMMLGGIFLLGGTFEAGAESWLSVLLSAPVLLLLALLCRAAVKNGGFFEICEARLGRIVSRAVAAALALFALMTAMLLLGNYQFFIYTLYLPETPRLVTGLAFVLTGLAVAMTGREAAMRASRVSVWIVVIILAMTLFASVFHLDISNLPRPLFVHGAVPVLSGALSLSAFPFCELILLLPLLRGGEKTSGKGIISGAAIAWLLLAVLMLRNVLVLGEKCSELLLFKSFSAIRMMSIGEFFQRLEVLISIVYIVCDVLEFTLCILSAERAVSFIFGSKRSPVTQLIFCTAALTAAELLLKNEQSISAIMVTAKFYSVPIVLTVLVCVNLIRRKKGVLLKPPRPPG